PARSWSTNTAEITLLEAHAFDFDSDVDPASQRTSPSAHGTCPIEAAHPQGLVPPLAAFFWRWRTRLFVAVICPGVGAVLAVAAVRQGLLLHGDGRAPTGTETASPTAAPSPKPHRGTVRSSGPARPPAREKTRGF